jgi:hypothetical protein
MYHPILRPGAQRQLKKIGEADLVIGLPSYKNAQTAAHVARVALDGAHHYFPQLRTVLINADAGRQAATRKAVAAQASQNGHHRMVVSGRYEGILGQGNAVAALLDAALALDARAIIILDTYTRSVRPRWIAGLAHLILEDKADLVLPRYRQWPTPEGTLSDLIIYPLFRALWGRSVRHPAAPDFALSPRVAAAVLDKDIWGTAVASFGLPPWLTTYGIMDRWRVAQAALGTKSYWTNSMPGHSWPWQSNNAELRFKGIFHDVLSVILRTVYHYRRDWKDVTSFRSQPTLTQFASDAELMPEADDDVEWLLDNLAVGWMEYRLLWQQILTPENLGEVETLAALPPDRFYFPSDLWARIVYDFAVVFNKGEADPAQVVDALLPLYYGRQAAFSQEVAGLASVGREGTVAAQAVEFEETRQYLKKRWHGYQPGRRSNSIW